MEGHHDEIRYQSTKFILNNAVILILLMHPMVTIVPQVSEATTHFKASPCCSFPCKNGGACIEACGQRYRCDCTGTNHYGKNCQSENFSYRLTKLMRAGAMMLGLTDVVDTVQYEPKFSRDHTGFCNENFVRPEPMLLSPVPERCPTPLGIAGFQMLPSVETVFDLVLKRRRSNKHSTTTNLLFVIFAQFLANQMWQCPNSKWLGSEAMYGNYARTGLRGKVIKHHDDRRQNIYQNLLTDVFQNIILQEHNRVCQILSLENPKWNDQRLFDTATLIVTGQILTIADQEWLPTLQDARGAKMKVPYVALSRVPKEMKLAFFWPQMFPESVGIEGARTDLGMLLSSRTSDLPRGGLYQLVKIAAMTAPERMGPQNVPEALEEPTKAAIMEGRRWKFQSYNNYREFLGLGRLQSFSKLTDNDIVKTHLENMYGDVDGLELVTGLLLETPTRGQLLGETTSALITNTIFKAIVSHPLHAVPFQKKLIFGGQTGWSIVKNAKIQTLVCNNVFDKRLCEKERAISFKNKTPSKPQTCRPTKVGHIRTMSGKKDVVLKRDRTPRTCSFPSNRRSTKALEKRTEPPCKEIVRDQMEKVTCLAKPPEPAPQPPEPKAVCPMKPEDKPTKRPEEPTKFPEELKTFPTKRCCMKRPWYRIFTSRTQSPKPVQSQSKAKSKKEETCPRLEPKLETQCGPKLAAPKKCCGKRAWYRSWLRG